MSGDEDNLQGEDTEDGSDDTDSDSDETKDVRYETLDWSEEQFPRRRGRGKTHIPNTEEEETGF